MGNSHVMLRHSNALERFAELEFPIMIRDDIILEDTTLRDGEQAPGLAWSKTQKLRLLGALLDSGVKWVEVGIPQMGGEELEFIREALDHSDRANLVAWNRGVLEDIALSLDIGYRFI